MEQIARDCDIALVAYTITHHTRQSAIGLPFIVEKEFGGKKYSVTEYTMSEIIGSVYEQIEKTGCKEEFSTVLQRGNLKSHFPFEFLNLLYANNQMPFRARKIG